ncbi:MspA family porin [Mycobacteroides abscessus]|uniref:MspA family porin n=1 Tax=Mycobacteroides abscessus TaxID=36809 RepID=UPI001D1565B3|nr:MspA family porin [Mycobacteroides abscessus]UEA49098.1 MspA family porin [Mycobacteroides abscessus subsp. abscessus]UEA55096.1 MspA family porin [Mycobacteroides abscessus]
MAGTFIRCIRSACFAAVVVGVAVLQAPPVFAEPVTMQPEDLDQVTPDGWQIHLNSYNEVVNSIPNLANASNSREAFVNLYSSAAVTGGQGSILDSLFIMGYQLGCQSDVSSGLQLGGAVSGGVSGTGSLGSSNSIGGSVGGGATGYVQTDLEPGVIVDLPMSNMALNPAGRATLDITNLHVKVDACGGDVTIRSYAYLRISTTGAHSSYAIYGEPIKI